MIRLATLTLFVTLAASCGGGSSTATGSTGSGSGAGTSGGTGTTGSGTGSGSSTGSGSTSGTAQYDTLTGTFSAQSGVQATFTGAMEEFDLGTGSSLNSCSAFTVSSVCFTEPKVTVTSPSGATGTISFGVHLPAPPVAGMFSCAADGGFSVSFTAGDQIYIVTSCTATLDAPAEVSSKTGVAFYFAHGSLSATMVGPTQFSDGGYDVGTLSATW